jgi:hypothetical protein
MGWRRRRTKVLSEEGIERGARRGSCSLGGGEEGREGREREKRVDPSSC